MRIRRPAFPDKTLSLEGNFLDESLTLWKHNTTLIRIVIRLRGQPARIGASVYLANVQVTRVTPVSRRGPVVRRYLTWAVSKTEKVRERGGRPHSKVGQRGNWSEYLRFAMRRPSAAGELTLSWAMQLLCCRRLD